MYVYIYIYTHTHTHTLLLLLPQLCFRVLFQNRAILQFPSGFLLKPEAVKTKLNTPISKPYKLSP